MDESFSQINDGFTKLNVDAAEFVPSWIKTSNEIPSPNNFSGENSSDSKLKTPALDCWEQAEDSSHSSETEVIVSGNEQTRMLPDTNCVFSKIRNSCVSEALSTDEDQSLCVTTAPLVKEHMNIVFIGHVDAGKSTIGGQVMYLTGMVDKRTLDKYEKEAKEKNRETWYLSWALDTNLEERDKGKTVEVGRAYFQTEQRHFTILDAPGHKSFVPNMIGGASQADVAVLVISARRGEFETGFDRGGQTREHAMLVKTAGVRHLIVLVNKMDDPTVDWCEKRYVECRDKLLPYLKKCGFNLKTDVSVMPCSGLTGAGLLDPVDPQLCPWHKGVSFITYLDTLPSIDRNESGAFLMPIVDKYGDRGTIILGKVESGSCKKGDTLLLMPNKMSVFIDALWSDDLETSQVVSGENVKIRLKGVDEAEILSGFVLCDPGRPVPTGKVFDVQLAILEHKSIICAGYTAICHLHTVVEEVTVKELICEVDKKTGERSRRRPRFVKQEQVVIMRLEASGTICLDTFKRFPQLGRFTLRDEGRTIAIGKVLKIVE